MEQTIKIKGIIQIKQVRKGEIIAEREVRNTITTAGLAQIALLAGDAAAVPFTFLGVGIGTTAANAANTALESEIVDSGLERAAATVSRVTTTATNDTLQLVKSWSATGTKAVTECGALNAASAGTLLGRQVFSAINVESDDSIQITYKFIFA